MIANEIFTEQIGEKVKKDKPPISVIIPNYNTAQFISETLDSVFAQTFTDFEVIVVNDAAPDTEELKKVLENYREKIIFIDRFENTGTSAVRNFAAGKARGEFLCFLDADDVWHPTFLEELIEFRQKNNFDMVYADAETFGSNYGASENYLAYNPSEGGISRRLLIEGKCLILPSGSLIGKSVFEKVGGFDPQVKRTEDFDLWMRMLFENVHIGYRRKILFKFRIRPGSGSGDSFQRIERSIICWEILQKKLPFTNEENEIINRHIENERAALLRAKGRFYISRKNWKEAANVFRQAKIEAARLGLPLKHRLKISAVLFLLNFSPGILLQLFKIFRSNEIEYMP